jgi:glucose/arabinose dehydrogenase
LRRIFAVLAVSLVAGALAPGDAHALELPGGFSTVEQVSGLDGPIGLAYAPDGRLFIAEKAGRVRVVAADGRLQPDPVIDISDHVNSYWDRGLLGLAVDADFATNGFLYLLYVYEGNALNPSGPKTSRLTRVKVTNDNRPDPAAPETVLAGSVSQAPCPAPADTVDCIPADGSSHAIGTVRADPDGTLWFGSGDGADWAGVDPTALRAYDEHTFAGKLMHVGRDGRGLPGHPFCADESDLTKVCTKLYAKGFRNPYRFQLRPAAGPLVGDVGWGGFEEIDLAKPGRSYGWPCYEGAGRTPGYEDLARCSGEYAAGPSAHQSPTHSYPHAGSAAIVAGPRYEAARYPAAYRNAWFFGDYAMGLIWSMTIDENGVAAPAQQFASGFEGGVDLERAPNGDLVYVSFGDQAGTGTVHRIVYGNRAPVPRASATPSQGVAPLAVTLSADGSVDPDGEAVTYEWDLESDGFVDATGPSVSHSYAAGAHRATLTVRDARGLAASDTVEVLADESPPTVSLIAPAAGETFRYGRPIELKGAGTDVQDGTLDDAALHWRITLHHGGHTHVIEADRTGAESTFTPPGDHDADSALEFRLTARDSAGLEDTRAVTLQPETIRLRLESSPPGAVLSYGGLALTAPVLRTTAIGFHPTVSGPAELVSDGRRFVFDHWSDGGDRLHEVVIPDADLTLTAVYASVPDAGPPRTDTLPASPPAPAAPAIPAPPARPPTPRITLDDSSGSQSSWRLHGRVVGGSGSLRVDVALRLRRAARGCRWWRRELGRLSTVTRKCDRPVWMKVAVDRSGRWRLDLRGRPRAGSYTVLTRARTASARPRVVVRASSRVRIP